MKKNLIFSFALFIFLALHIIAKATPSETNTIVFDQMGKIEKLFDKLNKVSESKAIDPQMVNQDLGQMIKEAKVLDKVNDKPGLKKNIRDLITQLESFSKKKDRTTPAGLQKGLNEIFKACFQCHQTHEPDV